MRSVLYRVQFRKQWTIWLVQLHRVMRGAQRRLSQGNPTRFHVDALGRDDEVGRYEDKGPERGEGGDETRTHEQKQGTQRLGRGYLVYDV
jgi:hypothetical protein